MRLKMRRAAIEWPPSRNFMGGRNMSNRNLNQAPTGSRPIVSSYDTSSEYSLEHYVAVRSMVEKFELGGAVVSGIYRDVVAVDHALDALRETGFRNTDISVLFAKNEATENLAGEKRTEGALGAGLGAKVDGSSDRLPKARLLAIAGAGPLSAGSPVVSAAHAAGSGGIVGGIADAMVSMGVPEHGAKHYEACMKEGGILLSVHANDPDRIGRAKGVLERTRANDIFINAEKIAERRKTDKLLRRAS
jgi:hypothetical protein